MRISDWSSDVCSSDLDWKIVKHGMEKLMTAAADPPTLGAVMRGIRSRNGWTPKHMSAQSGIPVSTLTKVEHDRSEGRGVGKECVSPCRSRWSPCHYNKQASQP